MEVVPSLTADTSGTVHYSRPVLGIFSDLLNIILGKWWTRAEYEMSLGQIAQ